MEREKEISNAAEQYVEGFHSAIKRMCKECFVDGVKWADQHPRKGLVDIEKACECFCKVRCKGKPPRSTCTSLGTCREYDDFRKTIKEEQV